MIKSQIVDKFFVEKPFMAHGFGLCLLDAKDEVQGFALTNYPIGDGDEIEVSYRIGYEDQQEYRKKGIGTTLVTMFLEMAIQRGYKPIWDAATEVSATSPRRSAIWRKRNGSCTTSYPDPSIILGIIAFLDRSPQSTKDG